MRPLFALPLLLATALAAPAVAPRGPDADEAAIRALDAREAAAVLARDTTALRALWDEAFVVNSPRNTVVPDRAGVLALMRWGVIHYASFERTAEAVRVRGDLAVVMGAETVRPLGAAPHAGRTVHRRYTNVWARTGPTWRAVARHAHVVSVE